MISAGVGAGFCFQKSCVQSCMFVLGFVDIVICIGYNWCIDVCKDVMCVASVVKRISEIKQPRGGYVKLSQFDVDVRHDDVMLFEKENISASIVGMTVDYLTRLCAGADAKDAFSISLKGAFVASRFGMSDAVHIANSLLDNISGIDCESVVNACKLTTFDVWLRNMASALLAKSYMDVNPDENTVHNIQTMVERSISFLDEYGPITQSGFVFIPHGYTSTVDSGDGDFLTQDTLWDFKVSLHKPTSKHILQVFMYFIMGQHSGNPVFKNITNVGIFNPRLNVVYTLPISRVEQSVISVIESDVIGY